MPIYEYRCESCGEHLEKMQGMSEDPLTLCPECGEEALKRLISQTSFVLKGSGWYATDYGTKAKDTDKSKPASTGGSAASSSESSSKPASSGSEGGGSSKATSTSSDAA